MIKYKFLEHTADVKFNAYGKNVNKTFENSAIAMFKSMYTGKINKTMKNKINVSGRDYESLLYNFLEELLFLLDSKNFFISSIKVKISQKKFKLTSIAFGDDASKYKIGLNVKAVTYNEMFVKKIKNKWICQVVLDV